MTKSVVTDVPNECACDLVGEVVCKSGRVRLRVSGTSMVPTLRPGDLITVESAGLRVITTGEIVVFKREGRLVVHRVANILATPVSLTDGKFRGRLNPTHLVTRGDRAGRDDSATSISELVGRVTQIERGSKHVRLRSNLTPSEKVISRMLLFSDRATFLYLRIAAL